MTNVIPITWHKKVASPVNADIRKYIQRSPAAINILLFKARLSPPKSLSDSEDVVGNLEARELKLEFDSPLNCYALALPLDMDMYSLLADGLDQLDQTDSPMVLLISEPDVPEQSVIWYETLMGSKKRVSLLYVLHSKPIGIHGLAGEKHYLIPFTQGIKVLQDSVVPDPDNPEASDISHFLASF